MRLKRLMFTWFFFQRCSETDTKVKNCYLFGYAISYVYSNSYDIRFDGWFALFSPMYGLRYMQQKYSSSPSRIFNKNLLSVKKVMYCITASYIYTRYLKIIWYKYDLFKNNWIVYQICILHSMYLSVCAMSEISAWMLFPTSPEITCISS